MIVRTAKVVTTSILISLMTRIPVMISIHPIILLNPFFPEIENIPLTKTNKPKTDTSVPFIPASKRNPTTKSNRLNINNIIYLVG